MIIIKTADGDRFINDDKTLMVDHIKRMAKVTIRFIDSSPVLIPNVEKVTYISHAQPFEYEDKGSELSLLIKQKDELYKTFDSLRKESDVNNKKLEIMNTELKRFLFRFENDIPRGAIESLINSLKKYDGK